MGYELHITRKNDFENEEEESSITLAEWLEYIQSDEELELTNGYQKNFPNVDTSWNNSPGFCLWKAHPENKPSDSAWFDFYRGIISAKYPDEETIRKMISIARVLNGRVHGDDGESYDDGYFDNRSNSISNENLSSSHISKRKPWWKFW